MKKHLLFCLIFLFSLNCAAYAQDKPKGKFIGNFNTNKFDSDSINNPFGRYGSKFSSDSIKNPFGEYGSKFSDKSVNNPYTNNAPKIYDQNGNYAGKLSKNKYDPDSIFNSSSPYYIKRMNKYGNYSIYSEDPNANAQIQPSISTQNNAPAFVAPAYTPAIAPTGYTSRKTAIATGIINALANEKKQHDECDAVNAQYEEIEARTGIPQPRLMTPDEQIAYEEKIRKQRGGPHFSDISAARLRCKPHAA